MSLLAFGTWTAVVVLVVGSVLLFLWFLVDVRAVLGDPRGSRGEEDAR